MSRLPDIKSVLSGIAGKDLEAPAIESPEGTRAWLEVSPMAQSFDFSIKPSVAAASPATPLTQKRATAFSSSAVNAQGGARSGNPTAGPFSDDQGAA